MEQLIDTMSPRVVLWVGEQKSRQGVETAEPADSNYDARKNICAYKSRRVPSSPGHSIRQSDQRTAKPVM